MRFLSALLIAIVGCASPRAATPAPASADSLGATAAETTAVAPNVGRAPLASLAAQRLAVLPVHYFRALDTLGLATGLARPRDYLRIVDDEIKFALTERGIASRWVLPEELARIAKRNPTYTADPYAMAAESIRPGVRRREPQLPEPLASQIRSLAALTQARYLVFPVELRLENGAGGKGRALLHVSVLDARLSNVRWAGEVWADAEGTPGTPLAAAIASRMADLFAAP